MNFLHRVGNGLARFMYGRNGMDQLNRALFIAYLILCVVRTVVVAALRNAFLGTLCDILMLALAALLIWRMFSKNVYQRQGENGKWVNFWYGFRTRHADKEHKYFKCRNCKTICRVPVGKGKIVITCPKCGNEIHGRS